MSALLPKRGLYSIDELTRDQIVGLLDRAEQLRTQRPYPRSLADRLVGLMFFEASTRTRVGFHAAAVRLGGATVDIGAPKQQADMECAESLEDTVRVVSAYCDLLVIRHADTAAVRSAFEASSVPVINGGAGRDLHPTQTLIDLFAIWRRLGTLDGLNIGIVGDLAGSRSAKSLMQALHHFRPAELRLMSPLDRELPAASLASHGTTKISTSNLLTCDGLDVLYVAGCPAGTGPTGLSKSARAPFVVTAAAVQTMRKEGVVLCPLPRIDEIERGLDGMPQADYFTQSADGLFVRIAVVEASLGLGERAGGQRWAVPRDGRM